MVISVKFLLFSLLLVCGNAENHDKVYIVYMGSSSKDGKDFVLNSHIQLLSSVVGSEEDARGSLIHSYGHAFGGFSAVLSEEQAVAVSAMPGIVSVFPDPVLNLHTTRSWDFLKEESGVLSPSYTTSGDTIIGFLDTGIWPESPSFSDGGFDPIPARWKGVCMEGPDFSPTDCNRKIIGARYYNRRRRSRPGNPVMSPRDYYGHGSHTASTAAGTIVENADYYGLAKGTARGGSPTSRIAVYKVCSEDGCYGSNILAAFDDAVQDGVDIISISLGSSSEAQMDFLSDPIALGALHATQRGILVVCSAGNVGPDAYTVVNAAPWIFTVAATTIDRDFQSDVILGNGKTYKGEAINFSSLTRSDMCPIVYAGSIPANTRLTSDASNCFPDSLNATKAKGKIVLCSNGDQNISSDVQKDAVQSSGGKGVILIDELENSVAFDYGTFPSSAVTDASGSEILSYINSAGNPTATILRTVTVSDYKPAPVVPFFSSRGPGILTENILKPDISAPGVNILAAWIPTNDSSKVPDGEHPSYYALDSGTSMACPHVSGASAFLRSSNPTWSSSAIRSALITTATTVNNLGDPVTNGSDIIASPFEMGAGEISPLRALKPGLVYETTVEDYYVFLCNFGYKESRIKAISGNQSFACPSDAHVDLISNLNYPTIAISRLNAKTTKSITRTLTNVGPDQESIYRASINSPQGLEVQVSPETLVFSDKSRKRSFRVLFSATKEAEKGYSFGSVTWSDGTHVVRTSFAVNIK